MVVQITPHFNLAEFASHDGVPYPDDWVKLRLLPLCQALEVIRDVCGAPLQINSGYRTEAYNKSIGGALHSQHCQGRAADIAAKGVNARDLCQVVLKLIRMGTIPDGGVGSYATWVHVDLGPAGRRWTK